MAIAIANTSLAVGEIQREYLFGVKFTNLPNRTGELSRVYSQLDLWQENEGLFDCFCVKGKFPDRKQDKIRFRYGGEYFYYAGVDITEKAIQFQFLLSENSEIFGFLNALKDLTGDLFNNRARPKSVLSDAYAGNDSYGPDELAIAISMVSVDKTHGSRNMYRELRNCSVYSVEGITADKGAQQTAPSLVTVEIGFDFIGRATLDAADGAVWGNGSNYLFDWASGELTPLGRDGT